MTSSDSAIPIVSGNLHQYSPLRSLAPFWTTLISISDSQNRGFFGYFESQSGRPLKAEGIGNAPAANRSRGDRPRPPQPAKPQRRPTEAEGTGHDPMAATRSRRDR